MSSLNGADLAILAIVTISVVVSMLRGFIKEVFSILVWLAAVFAAFQVAGPLAGALEPIVTLPSARVILAFASVFILVLAVGALIAYLIGRLIESTGLSATDRLFGALFGLARGVLIVVVAVMLARVTPFTADPWWHESKLLPGFERLADRAVTWLPPSLGELLDAPAGGAQHGRSAVQSMAQETP